MTFDQLESRQVQLRPKKIGPDKDAEEADALKISLILFSPKQLLTTIFFLLFFSRIATFFAILSVAILIVSTLLAMVGHCAKGQKMLVASGLYALSGKNRLHK